MSYTEIRQREGLPYGGIPSDELLYKLEETDPELVDEVRGWDEFHGVENDYDDYVRAEIIDWAPDAPYLESDHPQRDPGLSRSMLNLRFNGTRGSHPELPRHPELFYGFTGNDPRGAVNDPRFDQVRGQVTSRAADLTARMGDNDDHHIAESPWTNQSISYGMKELQRRLKANTKIFSVQKEGRPWSRNVVQDALTWGRDQGDLRAAMVATGAEALPDQGAYGRGYAAASADSAEGAERFRSGDQGSAADLWAGGVRGVDAHGEVAPWRHTTGEADLGVQRYGQDRGGRGDAPAGGRPRAAGTDQALPESQHARGVNRAVLGASMALAARRPRGAHDQDRVPGAGLPGRDPARGLAPAQNAARAYHAAVATTAQNSHLTNASAIVSGLREGSAASRRRIAGRVSADGARHGDSADAAARGTGAPTSDGARAARLGDVPLTVAAAARGLQVHAYRGAAPQHDRRVATAQSGADAAAWRAQREALALGMSKTPGEWRSATQGHHDLSDAPERVFGLVAEVPGAAHGAAPVGPKTLRAHGWSDSAGLTDDLSSEFAE